MFVRAAVAHAPADLLESRGGNGVDAVARGEVSLDLLVGPGRLELRDQIARTDHVLAQSADQIDRAAIHQRNREDRLLGEYCIAISR